MVLWKMINTGSEYGLLPDDIIITDLFMLKKQCHTEHIFYVLIQCKSDRKEVVIISILIRTVFHLKSV